MLDPSLNPKGLFCVGPASGLAWTDGPADFNSILAWAPANVLLLDATNPTLLTFGSCRANPYEAWRRTGAKPCSSNSSPNSEKYSLLAPC